MCYFVTRCFALFLAILLYHWLSILIVRAGWVEEWVAAGLKWAQVNTFCRSEILASTTTSLASPIKIAFLIIDLEDWTQRENILRPGRVIRFQSRSWCIRFRLMRPINVSKLVKCVSIPWAPCFEWWLRNSSVVYSESSKAIKATNFQLLKSTWVSFKGQQEFQWYLKPF